MINKVTLIGHAGGDPDFRTIDTGAHVARVSVATNESYKDKDGNWQTNTEWHNVILWRDLAERAAQQIKKGSTVYIEGKISYRKYTDREGVEKTQADIVASTFRLFEKRERGADNRMPDTEPENLRKATDSGAEYLDGEKAHYGSEHSSNTNLPQMKDPPPPPNPIKNQFETGQNYSNAAASGADDLPF